MSFFNGSTLTWVPPPVTCKGAYLANLSGLILQQHFARDRHFWGISRRDVPRLAACVGRFPWGLQGDKRTTGRSRSHHPEIGKAGRLGNDRPSLGARLGVGYRGLGVCVGRRPRWSGLGSRRRTIWISFDVRQRDRRQTQYLTNEWASSSERTL